MSDPHRVPDHSPESPGDTRGLTRRRFLGASVRTVAAAALFGATGTACGFGAPSAERTNDRAGDERAAGDAAVEARWYERQADGSVLCTLCPHRCRIARGARGPCRVRENRDGTLVTVAYGNPALIQADPVERKPFFHVVPGSRALSVSTSGCPLECAFCEVWDVALVRPEEIHTHDAPPEAVVEQAKAIGARSVSYAFGEPIAFSEYVLDTARIARANGLLNLVHTSGYISDAPLAELLETVDAVNVDLKAFDDAVYTRHVGGSLAPVLDTLRAVRAAGVHLEITNLVIPTVNDDRTSIARMCRFIRTELGADVPLHFARFYPLYKLANLPPTPVSTLDAARRIGREAGLEYVYVARVTGHDGENTYCPHCGRVAIRRLGFMIEEMNVSDGACASCHGPIRGIWA